MIILISGTPGTGKTSIARIIAKELKYEYIHIGDHDYYVESDEGVKIINIDKMIELLKGKNNIVVDSHLSHYYPSGKNVKCLITRCDPAELKNRLIKRGYTKNKIDINLEAEAIDLILQEALSIGHKIYEINTTNKTINSSAAEALKAIKNNLISYGKNDFSYYIQKRINNNNTINNTPLNNKD